MGRGAGACARGRTDGQQLAELVERGELAAVVVGLEAREDRLQPLVRLRDRRQQVVDGVGALELARENAADVGLAPLELRRRLQGDDLRRAIAGGAFASVGGGALGSSRQAGLRAYTAS